MMIGNQRLQSGHKRLRGGCTMPEPNPGARPGAFDRDLVRAWVHRPVIVCVLIALFPIITNTLFGLQSADHGLHDLLTLHGADRNTRFRKLELRAAVPAIFTGFRISAGLSVIGAIVGEFFFVRGGQSGLGNLLDLYRGQLETSRLFTALALSSILGIVVFWTFTWVGNLLTRSWHESAQVETW